MDFNDTPEEAAFRAEVRAWLEANAELRGPQGLVVDSLAQVDAAPFLGAARFSIRFEPGADFGAKSSFFGGIVEIHDRSSRRLVGASKRGELAIANQAARAASSRLMSFSRQHAGLPSTTEVDFARR